MPLLFCKYNEEMKYPQLASSTTPASLQDWLEGELESRGIDGVYTRYILSLLQEDGTDIEPLECEHLFGEFGKPHWKQKESYHNLGKELIVPVSEKPRHCRLKSLEKERSYKGELYHCDCMVLLDSEERKKSVAIECLKSASEQKIGLEKLIDEVCAKLKKIRSVTGTASESMKEENDAKISLSSPQEQAEKYYAAFPALCGRLEPLTQLCQQQESTRAIMTVWDKKKIQRLLDEVNSSKHPLESIDLSDDEFGSDCDSTFDKQSDQSEKENEDSNIEHETQRPLDKEMMPVKEKCDAEYQPLFIVPKVKMSVHRIPFSVKCLPFNPNNIDQSKKLSIPNKKEILITEIKEHDTEADKLQLPVALSELDTKDNADSTAETSSTTECRDAEGEFDLSNSMLDCKAKLNVLPYSTTLNISFAESFNHEDYAYNELAGKFNNQLASIWTQNVNMDQSQSSNGFPLIFEVSLKENYLKAPCFSLQLLEKSINDIKSIWTVSQDDFKLMGANTSNLLPVTYFAANNTLSSEQKCDSQHWEDSKNKDSFESSTDSEDDTADIELPLPFMSVGFSERENMNENGSSTFIPWQDHVSPDLTSEKSGIYSLWTSTSSILALERSDRTMPPIVDQTLSKDCDSECHYEREGHWSNDTNAIFVEEMPLNKSKCTLTYHKGESLFVEVIPSPKPAREINKASPYETDIIEHDTLHPVSSDSDDLLTSPKTHFQPIHQDSLDLDNGDDETMTLTLQTNSPANECNFRNMIMLQNCVDSSPVEQLRENNRCASVEINDYERGRPNIYSSQGIHVNSPYNNLLNFSKDDAEDREKSCSVPLNNFSGFPHVWSNTYYKEKATNTDSPSCGMLDRVSDYSTGHVIDSDRKYGILNDSEDDIVLTVNEFLSLNDMPGKLDKWKWSTNDNNECWNLDENASGRWETIETENDFICTKHTGGKLDIRNNLEALKKEIEEEEEELFRDITRLNDETYDSDLDSPDNIFSTYYEYEMKRFSSAKQWSTDTEVCDFPYDTYGCIKQDLCCWESSLSEDYTDYEGSFRLCTSDAESKNLFPSVPADKVVYSSDLEDEWRRSSHPFSISHGRKTKYRHRIAPQRKPCSFYLEGSCRRSDCKFSHDLGNITCRFWEEGSCFKGDTCPFLHGYLGDGFRRDCRHRKSNYVLESEADFPSLSTSVPQDFDKESPRDIPGKGSRRKKRRGKIQHGLMISSSWPQQKGNKH